MKAKLKKYGYRDDFDWNTRFHLVSYVDNYRISTVDLGIDHSFGFGKPLYYETMIFNSEEENKFEDYQERYSTKDEAIIGHNKTIEYVKEKIKEI